MRPRITISKNENKEIEIWINEAGRDLLVRELSGLSESNDHFHLTSDAVVSGVLLEKIPYRDTDEVFEWGKVLFRPDAWDKIYFPHVLNTDEL